MDIITTAASEPQPKADEHDHEYTDNWQCQQPPDGTPFIVKRSAWNAGYTVRTIYEIELLQAG